MCGISGLFGGSFSRAELVRILDLFNQALKHRGPDAAGTWISPQGQVGLAHTRLAIVDLSPNGVQPMVSASGRSTMAFNGEIYNHLSLRPKLQKNGLRFRGHSDTESLLELIEAEGVEKALEQTRGMFAFAFWNETSQSLTLARDRLGEKPLYYAWVNGQLAFGSELKVFHKIPGFQKKLNMEALSLYLKYSFVPHPYSIYQGVQKLPPGTWISGRTPEELFHCSPKPYWKLSEHVLAKRSERTESDALSEVESMLSEVVRGQLMSDVPIGAFLSGGVDSSLICAIAQKQSSLPLKTFTIGYEETEFSEAAAAKQVAKHLGTEHTEWIVTQEDSKKIIPNLATIYDEPFSDSSQLPTTLLSQLTRQKVTVAISGDGGDELFGGYNRYLWVNKLTRRAKNIPQFVRSGFSHAVHAFSPDAWTKFHSTLKANNLISASDFGTKIYKATDVLSAPNEMIAYDRLLSTWANAGDVFPQFMPPSILQPLGLASFTEEMMYLDAKHYLSDDIMVKVDRATMSTSLESRAPFLDHKLFELMWNLPERFKIQNGTSKWMARQILYKHVPQKLMDRPKMGFAVPIRMWLRNDLRKWGEDLLSANRIQRQGLFQSEAIDKMWSEHQSGSYDHSAKLWSLLMFQTWAERWEL